MGLLPDTWNCGLRMHRECRERFPRHRLQSKPLLNDHGKHHGTCVTHVPWRMSGSLTYGGGENDPGIPGACATQNVTYLTRDPWQYPWGGSRRLWFSTSYCANCSDVGRYHAIKPAMLPLVVFYSAVAYLVYAWINMDHNNCRVYCHRKTKVIEGLIWS